MTQQTSALKHSIPYLELRSLLLYSLLILGTALAAHAQNPQPAAAQAQPAQVATTGAIPHNKTTPQDLDAAFNRADSNGDGKLSRQEAEHFPAIAPRFEQIDTNHDHFISREEFRRAAGS